MRRTPAGLAAVLFAAVVPACVDPGPAPAPRAASAPAAVPSTPAARIHARLEDAGLAVVAADDDGTPRLLRATAPRPAPTGATPEATARAHLAAVAPALDVPLAALDTLRVRRVHTLHGGARVVLFRSVVDGLDVYRGDVAVLLRPDGALAAIAGAPRRDALPDARVRAADLRLGAAEAVARALADRTGRAVAAADVVDRGRDAAGDLRFGLARGAALALDRPARARLVLAADGARLIPAWWVEAWAPRPGGGTGVFDAVIAAADGRVLVREDLTASDAVTYRVWASGADARPTDGPLADFTPHPTGLPDGSTPAATAPALVSMESFDHNPAGVPDPWLPPNPTATQGNNVDAYTDDDNPDGFSANDLRATPTAAGVFDRTYDLAAEPRASDAQKMAAVVQAFYTTDWLHDWWYDSGFDEAAGDAQADNYGRGGAGNDRMLVEVQDGAAQGARDNANMATPADGESPRMQIYLWSAPTHATVTLTPGGALASVGASFGTAAADVTAAVALVDDGTAPTSDACQAVGASVAGKIALVRRGTCTFASKARAAQQAGAVAVILANNQPGGGAIAMPNENPPLTITIPVVSIGTADGDALEAAVAAGAVTAHLTRTTEVERDAALDNTVVAHEWGHYLHHRLAACGAAQCGAMSEGWGDFVALHLALRDGDDLDGTYALSAYAAGAIAEPYFGIRRAPYAHDLAKNGLTFRHISDGEPLPATPLHDNGISNAEVHNAGEVWAEWMFEAYTALLRETQGPSATRTFDDARRAMGDYVVAGLELTPPDATYTEQRDAILAAASAASPDDAATMAAAFARRGGGSCAVSPARDSVDLTGVVEDFTVAPTLALTDATLDQTTASCDDDGVLDAGEAGRLVVTVRNGGAAPLVGATLTATTTTAGATVTAAPVPVPDVAPYASTTVAFDVALDDSAAPRGLLDVEIAIDAPGACGAATTFSFRRASNLDVAPASSATDDVEADATVWTATGDTTGVWARTADDAGGHAWHGEDRASPSDTALESPDLPVSATAPLVITFRERHDFEAGPDGNGGFANWDGGVVELSTDGGQSWDDVGASAYGGTITSISGNVLGGRAGFVAQNPSYPAYDTVTLDLGTAYAGQTVRVRFRIGTDQAAGATGWDLDDLAFAGIDATPFASVVDDACSSGSGPDAGVDAGGGDGGADGGCCRVGGGEAGGTGGVLGLALALGWRRRRARRPA